MNVQKKRKKECMGREEKRKRLKKEVNDQEKRKNGMNGKGREK